MQQVLVEIFGLPIYGYGMMLFLTFVICTWMGTRWASYAGLPPEKIQDLAIVLFLVGILGARVTYILVTEDATFSDFYKIWQGGLVFYGSAIGGTLGYLIFYRVVLRKYQTFSGWKLCDVVAPIVCVGLALGRIGCLLNGCCYGHVACPDCAQIHFPMTTSPAQGELLNAGFQTSVGFSAKLDPEEPSTLRVSALEPDSAAAASGIRESDRITHFRGEPNVVSLVTLNLSAERILGDANPASAKEWREALDQALSKIQKEASEEDIQLTAARRTEEGEVVSLSWTTDPKTYLERASEVDSQLKQIVNRNVIKEGPTAFAPVYSVYFDDSLSFFLRNAGHETAVKLKVSRDGEEVDIAEFVPRTVGLYPTQLYETISMMLLLIVLLLFYPLRRHDGQVMVLLMMGYSIHRFTNEQLRDDTAPIAANLTLSQLISVGIFAAAIVLEIYLRQTQPRLGETPPPKDPEEPTPAEAPK